MKIVFVLSLLINIVFFLWEFNINSVGTLPVNNETLPKQILLVSELPHDDIAEKELVVLAEDNISDSTVGIVVNDKQTLVEMSALKSKSTVNSQQSVLVEEVVADISPQIEPIVSDEALVNQHSEEVNAEHRVNEDIVVENTVKEESIAQVTASLEPKIDQTEKKPVCYQVGPFKNSNAVEAWSNLNTMKSETLESLKKDSRVVSSYLVYYPAADNYQQGKENVVMLKEKGVKDLWLFRKGNLKGAVSLGLFVKESRAIALKDKLSNKGVTVDVMQRYKTIPMLYVKVLADKDSLVTYDSVLISECD